MSLDTPIRSPASESTFRTSRREDLVTVLLTTWITVGGFVDGFAHRNLDTLETFFTPWHGVLYSGYLATAGWVMWLVVRNRPEAASLGRAIPDGYQTSVAGVLLFAAGGIGDLVWHLVFGIEVSIDALLSPTHLMLLVGSLLMISGPFRASWRDAAYQPTRLRVFWPPLLAVTVAAAQVAFFFQYIDGFSTRFMQVPYVPGSEEGFFETVTGIASILVTTIIVMGALLLLMRRWSLPLGSGVLFFAMLGILMETLEGYEFPEDVIAPLTGGVIADLLLRWLRPRRPRLAAIRWLAFLVPAGMWGVRFAVFERFSDINWPVEVWTGTIAFAGLAAVGLSLLAFPTAEPDRDRAIA